MSKISEWFKSFFDKAVAVFKAFLKEVFTEATTKLLAEIQSIALDIVSELASTDLSNEEKRKQAFNKIKQYALEKGIETKDSLINLAIELALTKIKNVTNIGV